LSGAFLDSGFQLGMRFSERLFRLPFLGPVASDLGEASEIALLIAQSGDENAGPESRAVLAQPPAFLFIFAFRRGHLELLIGFSLLDFLGRIKAGKVLADDFLGP